MQVPIVKIERLVVVVDLRQVRVGEDLGQHSPFGTDLRLHLTVGLSDPAAIPLLLIFPFLGITDTGLGLDIVEPGVFNAFAIGPDVFASYRAGVTPDAFVEVEHHADLRADLHSAASTFSV